MQGGWGQWQWNLSFCSGHNLVFAPSMEKWEEGLMNTQGYQSHVVFGHGRLTAEGHFQAVSIMWEWSSHTPEIEVCPIKVTENALLQQILLFILWFALTGHLALEILKQFAIYCTIYFGKWFARLSVCTLCGQTPLKISSPIWPEELAVEDFVAVWTSDAVLNQDGELKHHFHVNLPILGA